SRPASHHSRAAPCPGHEHSSLTLLSLPRTLLRLPRDPLQELLDLAVLFALAVGPFADHLLLGAHVRDQALDRFGEVGHRRRGIAAAAAFLGYGPKLFHHMLYFAASAVAVTFAHRGGEPVFEVGIEAILRLARLQVEKAQDQRTREAKQRRRERNAHAAEWGGQSLFQGVEQGAG